MPAPSTPRLSVVIVTWNRRSDLEETLAAVFRQTLAPPEREVLVIDNASADGTCEWARSAYGGRIRLFRYPKNLGASVGRNGGIRLARAPFVCFLDSDAILLSPDCLERSVAALEAESALDGVAVAIWRDDAKTRPFCLGCYVSEDARYDYTRSVSETERPHFLSTCYSVWRRERLLALRGFDTTFFLGMEDIDLGLRALRARSEEAGGRDPAPEAWPMRVIADLHAHHKMSKAGRVMKPEAFGEIFRKIERHRLYLLLAWKGPGAVLRSIARGPFTLGRMEREIYFRRLGAWERWLALGWYPLRRLAALPWDLIRQRRDHLARSPLPEPVGEEEMRQG